MGGVVEFHGRLSRADKRPANPGDYNLLFRLHGHSRIGAKRDKVYWEESLERVPVSPGGFYRVVLGRSAPMSPKYFDGAPRWMSVQVVRSGRLDSEYSARIPIMGQELRLDMKLSRTQRDLEDLETRVRMLSESTPRVDKLVTRINRLGQAVSILMDRAAKLEEDGRISAIVRRIEGLTGRIDDVDKDDGRLDKVELELEDIVGPDGDVVDLNERMDRVEGSAPELIARLREREREAPRQLQLQDLSQVLDRSRGKLDEMVESLDALQQQVDEGLKTTLPAPETIGAIRRSGDAMTGGLTINRGGLQVLSGGITCRGAAVTSLEVSNVLKAPKAIVDSIELRGDLTVDSTKRVLQIRNVEGRQGSARRDGALHLNARGGGEVIVGHADMGRGLEVHGSVRAARVDCGGTGAVAQLFESSGDLRPGDVVRVNDQGTRVQRVRKADDTRVIGVVTDAPSLLAGGTPRAGTVAVALYGVVQCRVDADAHSIEAGDLLVGSRIPGHAKRCNPDSDPRPGIVLGKALAPLAKGRGTVPVLLGRS
jgi:hypothetical protein